jgi:hypothetical protein
MPFSKTSQLLISQVPKKRRELFASNCPGLPETKSRSADVGSERIFFADYLAPYSTQLLEATDTRTELCSSELCCQFDVRAEERPGLSRSASYRLAAFNGIRPLFGGKTAGVQVCAVISCDNSSLASCGQPTSAAKKLATFTFISIQMNASRVHSVNMPTTLQKSLLPLDTDAYELTSRILTDKLAHVHLRTAKNIHNLWTFGVYTREYGLDGRPFTVAT